MTYKNTMFAETEYADFSNPWSGIAVMIFVQAMSDLSYIGDRKFAYREHMMISREEIMSFLTSPWALLLAETLGISAKELSRFVKEIA